MADRDGILDSLRRRATAERFSAEPLEEELIRELVADAATAPSSFNIQHLSLIHI